MVKDDRTRGIAVIGMSCRFPGASSPAELWKNLCGGVESISRFTPDELLANGASPDELRDPAFVPAYGALEHALAFDAPFFGVSALEARVTDPQHRVFLECAWSALEDAGIDPSRTDEAIGVYAGSGYSGHLARVLAHPELGGELGQVLPVLANDKDFLATRVSYKLGLRGPSVAVQTACSTSLVAIHVACQSLLSRECDVALAGGVTIWPDQVTGYRYQEGGILSPDGHCRAFDAQAAGMVSGSGAGVVVLKRLADALRDGDVIHAVVKGSAINNDGSAKVGFTAPSVEGQAQAIDEAQALAGVDPADIGYVEAHGTGTPLGDPIEVAALSAVFSAATERKRFCALGAVKTNLGHLDTAAGVAGFIKAVLALKHRTLPPTLNFERANPETGLDDSPFYVPTELRPWESDGKPRRAGVSSFGIGGTNAHAVLEEASGEVRECGSAEVRPDADGAQLLVLSAKSDAALERMRANLAAHLADGGDSLADVAFTLQEGRAMHRHRWAAVARDAVEARDALGGTSPRKAAARKAAERTPSVAFLFPGQGTQYAGMARELYDAQPVFREELDNCAERLAPALGLDLRALLFPAPGGEDEANALLRQTRITQPALFAVEYALAKLWMSWGVTPDAMLGHSIGEYVAACLAGVFTLDAALALVAARGRLMDSLPGGAMLAVPLPEAEVRPLLGDKLSLAAVNSAAHCVVSGDTPDVDALEALLAGRDVSARRLHTSHAFHSAAMDPVLDAFAEEVRKARPSAPELPFLSNVTGDWITPAEAADPGYWVRHLRQTVRFADGVERLLADPGRVLLEVGPGETLGTFARRTPGGAQRVIVRSLPRADRPDDAALTVLEAAGALWTAGVTLDWSALRGPGARRKVTLPTYPFERTEHRLPPLTVAPAAPAPRTTEIISQPEPMEVPVAIETTAAPERASRMAVRVTEMFARLLGAEAHELDAQSSFLELGADSLLLMQLSRGVESTFGVRVPFRRLLDGLSTIGELSAHLAAEVPAEPEPEPVAVAVAVAAPPRISLDPAPAVHHANGNGHSNGNGNGNGHAPPPMRVFDPATIGGGSGVQEIVAQQLALMQRQLDLLNGAPAAVAAPTVAPAPALERTPALPHSRTPEPEAPVVHGPHRPVSATVGQGGELTERQAAHFAELVERYTARTAKSKAYAARSRPKLSDNRASLNFRLATKELMYPIVGEHSQGARLWDVDGNEYVDFTIGFGVHFFGHRPPFIVRAVEEQLRRGCHTGPQSNLAGPAAELFSELTGMERVTFCNTGSEAVMTALRIARTVTGRDRVVLFEGSYHGCFDGILATRGPGGGDTPRTRPASPGTPRGMVEDVVVLPYGAPEALDWIRAHAGELAAVLVEPVRTRDPELQPREFLAAVREATRASGTALIFDEMITGLRLGHRGAQGWLGVDADLATYGKVIGGGFPLGVVAGDARWMDAIDGGQWCYGDDSFPAADQTFFAGTFCKHPVTMAAAHAALVHLKQRGPSLYADLHARAARLVAELRAVLEAEGVPIRILHAASFFRFDFGAENHLLVDLLFHHMLLRGIYVWEGRACFVSTAHTDADCTAMVRALRESVQALRDGGFLTEVRECGSAEVRSGGGASAAVPAGLKLFPGSRESSALPHFRTSALSFPLTPAQRQVWVHAQLGDDASRSYNQQFVVGLNGRLHEDSLRAAIADLAAHHQALRTVFDPSGQAQHVLPELPGEPPLFVGPYHAADDEARLEAEMDEAVRGVFDLEKGPLFRVHLHQRGPRRQVLQFVIHHITADGIAIGLLERDLEIAYLARRDGRAPQLPPAMQFGEYARLMAEYAAEHADVEAEWLARFQGMVPLRLPADRARPRFPTHRAAVARLTLPAAFAAELRERSRASGCTVFTTVVAGLLATLHRVCGRDDLVVGVSSAGRPFPGADTLVGHCVDALPIRSRTREAQPLGEFLREVRGWLLDAYEHEELAYARMVEKLQQARGPGGAPLISVVLNLEPLAAPSDGETPRFAGIELEPVGTPALYTKVDLEVDTIDTGAEIELAWLYNAELFEADTILRMARHLERVLERIARDPAAPFPALDAPSAA
ncbi:MAG TPA: aminotransferase class III-fold pyridoxal phosphate-dependent enzyme, partial [Longimicrobiaceae bacterium]|nr:aminotransferase class III-fold pyridoxal phosphate-dependent enzyme [Longimicrobiaceae bacterium]